MNEQRKPKEYDAVLGGNNPPPVDGLVLGGIEGIKRSLESHDLKIIKTALTDAIPYQEEGLNLVIKALYDSPQKIRQHAVKILRKNQTVKAEQALLDYDPQSLFTQFSDWNLKDFNLESYLNDPVNTAYRIDIAEFENIISEIKNIEPQGSKIEALYCSMSDGFYRYVEEPFTVFVDYLLHYYPQLTNLKALFFADESNDRGERRWEYKRYRVGLDEASLILEAYPQLEFLRIQGRCSLGFSHIKHDHLKSLIVETRSLDYKTLEEIIILDLPKLEYLEIWLGADFDYRIKRFQGQNNDVEFLTNLLLPLLLEESFPNLKYLGFCSCEWADDLVTFLQNSPIIERLRILNLARGTLTDKGAEVLLNCPAINNLHTLDVSMNLLSPEMVKNLSQLNCNVIAEPQDVDILYEDNVGQDRYHSLYE